MGGSVQTHALLQSHYRKKNNASCKGVPIQAVISHQLRSPVSGKRIYEAFVEIFRLQAVIVCFLVVA